MPKPTEEPSWPRPLPLLEERWQPKGLAMIADLEPNGAACRFDTSASHDASLTAIAVGPDKAINPHGRYALLWNVIGLAGDHPDLDKITSRIVQISCIPGPDSEKIIRPYGDMVFRGGDLEVHVCEVPEEDDSNQVSLLGTVTFKNVIGMHVTPPPSFDVWEPFTD